MLQGVITVRLPREHAAFLQENLAVLATTTRQAMTRPGLKTDWRAALGSRAFLLESIDDAVRSAMLEVPRSTRGSPHSVETGARRGV
jgi:hypothetical protein